MRPEWQDFVTGKWDREINVRDFIQRNYTPYDGDESFLAGPTQNTKDLWAMVLDLQKKEREAGGVLDMDTKVVSTITSHGPGYLRKKSLVSRLTSLSRDHFSPTVVSVWQRRLAQTTDTKLILRSQSSSPLTERPTTQAASMHTMQR